MSEEGDYAPIFSEAAEIASELNHVNHGRCDLLVWICALKMAAKLVVHQHSFDQPEQAVALAEEVAVVDSIIDEMTLIVHRLKPGEAAPSDTVRSFKVGGTPPGERS